MDNAKAFEVFKKASYQAGLRCAVVKDHHVRETLFPFWRDAIHEIVLQQHGCSCQKGEPAGCLLTFSRREQETLFTGLNLGFEAFVANFQEARRLYQQNSHVNHEVSQQ